MFAHSKYYLHLSLHFCLMEPILFLLSTPLLVYRSSCLQSTTSGAFDDSTSLLDYYDFD